MGRYRIRENVLFGSDFNEIYFVPIFGIKPGVRRHPLMLEPLGYSRPTLGTNNRHINNPDVKYVFFLFQCWLLTAMSARLWIGLTVTAKTRLTILERPSI